MKRIIILAVLLIINASCESDDRIENPFLPDVNVNFTVNLNLPQFNDLKFQGNSEAVDTEGVGIKGIIIYNVNGDLYTAYELSDPNHAPSACSTLNGKASVATCNCDDGNSYDLTTGQPMSGDGTYGLKPYRITKQGNTLTITN